MKHNYEQGYATLYVLLLMAALMILLTAAFQQCHSLFKVNQKAKQELLLNVKLLNEKSTDLE